MKARNSSGRRASMRNTLGMKPDFSCTFRMRARMSPGISSRAGTGERLIGGGAPVMPNGLLGERQACSCSLRKFHRIAQPQARVISSMNPALPAGAEKNFGDSSQRLDINAATDAILPDAQGETPNVIESAPEPMLQAV